AAPGEGPSRCPRNRTSTSSLAAAAMMDTPKGRRVRLPFEGERGCCQSSTLWPVTFPFNSRECRNHGELPAIVPSCRASSCEYHRRTSLSHGGAASQEGRRTAGSEVEDRQGRPRAADR